MAAIRYLLLSLLALGALTQGHRDLGSQSEDDFDGAHRITRSAENINWNEVVDQLIEQFKQQIHEQGRDEVPLPSIMEHFERRFIITVRGRFEATDGHVANMTSVRRVGDVTVSESHPLTVSVLLRFDDLRIRYEHFHARVLSLNPRGKLEATVAENAFQLKVRLEADGTGCKLVYEDVQVMELAGVKVEVSGMSVLNKLASVIANRAAKRLRQTIAMRMEQLLDSELADIFNNTTLTCS